MNTYECSTAYGVGTMRQRITTRKSSWARAIFLAELLRVGIEVRLQEIRVRRAEKEGGQ